MMHPHRRYSLKPISITTPDDLAAAADSSWTLCTGWQFEHEGRIFLLLNDSTGENGAQEYALCRVEVCDADRTAGEGLRGVVTLTEWESYTLSWMNPTSVRDQLLESIAKGPFKWHEDDPDPRPFTIRADDYRTHRTCPLCA